MYTNLAIAVFGYSRPRHLIQLLDSIELNSEVNLIKLYIFIDGEKVDKNTREVSNCFQIAQEFASRHSNTEIYKHQKNLGLSNSIRFGIDYIFERHNEVIVLEDDLVCSEFFLDFCIQGLNRFRDEHRVASIHGYLPPLIKKFDEPQFLKGTDCWGWATWKDRWESVEWDARELVQKIGQGEIEHQFNLEEKFPFSRMLKEQADGKIDSWAIRWHANMFLQSRLTLYPNISLINNTGFDNSGTHGKKSNDYSTTISEVKIEIPANLEIVENATFRESVGDFYFSIINRREPIKYRLRKTLSLIIKTIISIKPLSEPEMVESREAESTVAFISVCDSNYVSRFLVMLDSLKKYIPKFTFFVVTLDNQAKDAIEKLNISNLEVVSLSDLDKELKGVIKSLQSSRKRKEFIFALTPLLIKYLSKRDHSDYLVYVDADIYFKGNILEIMHIDGASVGIFKHDFRNFIKNLEIYGRFNVGVVYFNRGGEGKRALDWWSNKCIESTSLDMESRPDVFGDQKYLDYIPNAFKEVVIHDNHVFCKGPWNTNDLSQVGSSNHPYFFHFSGLEIGQRFSILGFRAYKWKPSPSVRNLYRDYVREIKHWEKKLKIPRKQFLDKKPLRELLKIIKYKDFLWFPDSKTLKRRD